MRYCEGRGYKKEGSKPLFYYNRFIAATCRNKAKFGTITTTIEKLFYRWTDPFPETLPELSEYCNPQKSYFVNSEDDETIPDETRTSPNDQQRLVHGMFKPENLLHPHLQSYKVVLLTDRTQLDDQIKETAESSGCTIVDPKNISELKTTLQNDNSEIVSAMIHKFQERDYRATFPELNPSEKVLILTDEAHRSQYTILGANLDRALPNASRIAFTGTPIDKTEETFGGYIDKYTMRQSIDDGVTLAIVYEGRTHDAEVEDEKGAEEKFQDVFKDYNALEKTDILAYGSKKAYLEAKETIDDKARDMLRHYTQHILPNGYKAQVVCVSKDAAHRYRLALESAIEELTEEYKKNNPNNIPVEKLEKLKVAVVISDVDHNDKPDLKQYSDSKARKAAIAGFKMKFGESEKTEESGEHTADGNIGILVVVSMLLTAPQHK